MNPKISVIVPVHNAESTLAQCVGSLRRQTYQQLEILLVVNGCTDLSAELSSSYALDDDRIRVIELDKGSVTLARKVGIEESTGDYLAFCDSDDWYKESALETMLAALSIEDGIEIVNAGYEKRISPRLPFKLEKPGADHVRVEHRADWGYREYARFYNPIRYPFFSGMCASLYSRNVLSERVPKSILGNALRRGEDILVNAYAYEAARSIAYIPDQIYCYRLGGVTSGTESLLSDLVSYKELLDRRYSNCASAYSIQMCVEYASYALNVVAKRYQSAVSCDKNQLLSFYANAVRNVDLLRMAELLHSKGEGRGDVELAAVFLESDERKLYRYSKQRYWKGRAMVSTACHIARIEKRRLAGEYC